MPTTRRDMLWGACCALISACARPSNKQHTGADSTDTATADSGTAEALPCSTDAPGSDWIPLPLADHPTLAEVYGSAVVSVSGRPVVVAQIDKDCYVALDQRCTHEGCAIEHRDNNRFVCPCHGALFGPDGAVLGGPAPRPVDTHAVVRVGETVWISPTPT